MGTDALWADLRGQLLYVLIAPALWAYIQVSLNDVWRQEAEAIPGQEPPPSPSDPMPPPLGEQRQPPASESSPGS